MQKRGRERGRRQEIGREVAKVREEGRWREREIRQEIGGPRKRNGGEVADTRMRENTQR